MNTGESYRDIVVNGDIEDKEELYRMFLQKGVSNKSSKVDVRKTLIRNFMDACIYNESKKKTREVFKNSSLPFTYFDEDYKGLRTAIFWLGFTFEQIDEIEKQSIQIAHKYYPDKPENIEILNNDSVWKIDLTYLSSDKLENNQQFRFFKSDEVPVYVFKKIENNQLLALDPNGEIRTWDHYERKVVYINPSQKL